MIKGGDLIHLRLRDFQDLSEGGHVRRRELAAAVLNEMQIFDQQVAADFAPRQQRGDFLARCRLDLATLRRVAGFHVAANFSQRDRDGDAVVHRKTLQH